MPDAIITLLLAAGASTRYKTANKLLLPFGKSTVVRTSALTLLAGTNQGPMIVVTGHQQSEVAQALDGLPVCFAHNPRHREGEMISSIQTGLRAAITHSVCEASLVALGDMPLLPAAVVRQVLDVYRNTDAGIVAPRFEGIRGHPVLIARRFWDEAFALAPGSAMRELLKAHPTDVRLFDVDTDRVLRDVDTPELYEQALRSRLTGG
jgi:molybdenum cofactor cytidylyltransferase